MGRYRSTIVKARQQAGGRRPWWAYLIPLSVMFLVLSKLSALPAGDVKVQSIAVMTLAAASLAVCGFWALRISRATDSPLLYIQGTTTSRGMLWFWTIFFSVALCAPWVGLNPQSLLGMFDGQLWAFAGIGSVLLTAGPAYLEYKTAVERRDETARRQN